MFDLNEFDRLQAIKKIMEKIEIKENCWNWAGFKSGNGYGIFSYKKKSYSAARAIYQLFIGPISKELKIDHLCRNRLCLNPNHLEPVTHSENVKRAVPFRSRYRNGLCKHGHQLDGIRKRKEGGRYCKTCVTLNKRRQRYKAV